MTHDFTHIPRLFCAFEKRNEVSLDAPAVWAQMGLDYPEKDDELVYPRHWNAYDNFASVILLGPPRFGKTTEFKFQCSQCQNGFILELRDVDFTDGNLISSWTDSEISRWNAFLESDENGDFFIDSLDEGGQETPQAAKKVIRWIRDLDQAVRKRLRIHISCRELEWKRLDQTKWEELFPPVEKEDDGKKTTVPNYIKLALLRLEHSDIQSYMDTQAVDGKAFNRMLPKAAENLTRWPQTLRMLVELYVKDGCFGNIDAIYQQVVEKRIQESNEIRQSAARVPLDRRLRLAKELAAISILSGREVIALQDVEGVSQIDAGLVDEDLTALREVVVSELFERYSEGKARFEDHTLTGFLAVQWVLSAHAVDGVSNAMIEALLYADSQADEVVPKLRMFAGWLAILSPEIRGRLLERSPNILLSNDFPDVLSDDIKLELWEWMKQKYGDREWFNSGVYSDNAHKLVCADVIDDVGNVLRHRKMYGRDLRLFTLEILTKGRIKNFDDLLISLILDNAEDLLMRKYTLSALAKISPEKLPGIKPLLEYSTKDDSDLDLLGNALFHLFPEHLSINEVVRHLHHSMSSHHYGMYQLFVGKVAKESHPESRAIILESLAEKLDGYLKQKMTHQGTVLNWLHSYEAALHFDEFLLPQLEAWRDQPEKYDKLERWVHLLAQANTYGLVSNHRLKEISELLDENHGLRQQVGIIRIERLFDLKRDGFKPYDVHTHDRLYHAKAEDLEFWKQVLVEWSDQPSNKLEAAWNEFYSCWKMAEYPVETFEWLESQAGMYPSIGSLYDRNCIVCKLQDDHFDELRQDRKWERNQHKELNEFREAVLQNVADVQEGNQRWLEHIVSFLQFDMNVECDIHQWLSEHAGQDVAHAFSIGLKAYWSNSEPPSIESYADSSFLCRSHVITKAVEEWLTEGEGWAVLPSEFRQRAILAGLAGLWGNEAPKWFFEVVNTEREWATSFFKKVLVLEDASERNFIRLVHLFYGHSENQIIREVVLSFLLNHPDARIETIQQSLRLLCEKADEFPLNDSWLDQLMNLAINHAESGDDERLLLILAAVFRFRQTDVWQMVDNYLSGKDRVERFQRWLNAIEDIHLRFRFEGKWPAWVSEESVAAMLPDMFMAFPPSDDPGIDGYNNGKMYREDMGRLRNHGISTLAESGTDFSGKQLTALLKAPYVPASMYSFILNSIDEWKSRRAQNAWIPLKPEDVRGVLSQGLQPVRSAEELFNLVCRVLEEIKHDVENGEEDIRSVFWNEDTPKIETEFQKLIARDFRKSIEVLKNKIVSGRELDVAGNRPDIFATCILPDNQRVRVFLEMKRQQFYEKKKGCDASDVISSIRTQLIEKYLADAETKHGIYIVGWYGSECFGSYKTKLKKFNKGILPSSAAEFEKVLQGIADDEASKTTEVEAIRVFTIDLEQRSNHV